MNYCGGLLIFFISTTVLAADIAIIPDGKQVSDADARISAVYSKDIKEATTPQTCRALAVRMLKTAEDEKDPAVRYALLQMARREAVEGLDAKIGYQISEKLGAEFGLQPAMDPGSAHWIETGDDFKAKAKNETKKTTQLLNKLLAVECYLRAHPKARGVNRDETYRRIEDLGLVGSPLDKKVLLGTWDIRAKDIQCQWSFRADGTAI
jgi:hypothetical protein